MSMLAQTISPEHADPSCVLGDSWKPLANHTFSDNYCSASWDGHICWPETSAGDNVTLPCSLVMRASNSSKSKLLKGLVNRFCTLEAEWDLKTWGDYEACEKELASLRMEKSDPNFRVLAAHMLFFGSIVSLIFLLLALFLYFYFKRIRCARITIHINFMCALALKSVFFIVITQHLVIQKGLFFGKIEWVCKAVVACQLYSAQASINWMFIEGHYLNSKVTTNVFGKKPCLRLYYFFGWGVSLLTILVWLIVMESTAYPGRCWKGYGKSHFIWIIVAPLLAVLLANLMFLLNVIKVMRNKLMKLARRKSEWELTRKSMKTALILFPLLGMNVLLVFVNPGGTYHRYYILCNSALHSTQGAFVAFLYCFMGKDVHDAVRKEWRRSQSVWQFARERNQTSRTSSSSGGQVWRVRTTMKYAGACCEKVVDV